MSFCDLKRFRGNLAWMDLFYAHIFLDEFDAFPIDIMERPSKKHAKAEKCAIVSLATDYSPEPLFYIVTNKIYKKTSIKQFY